LTRTAELREGLNSWSRGKRREPVVGRSPTCLVATQDFPTRSSGTCTTRYQPEFPFPGTFRYTTSRVRKVALRLRKSCFTHSRV